MVNWNEVLSYSSEKEVVIRSVRLRLIKIAVQLLVLGYVGFTIIYYGGYQKVVRGRGFWQTKSAGVAVATASGKVWDAQDFVRPAKMEDEVFVTTNFLLTEGQTRGECNGTDPKTELCARPVAGTCCCTDGQVTDHGIATGKCTADGAICEIRGWCPFEKDVKPSSATVLENVGAATIYVRNFVRWEEEHVYLDSKSAFEEDESKYILPIHKLLEEADTSTSEVAAAGATIAVHAIWDCDIDHDPKSCVPEIVITRLDDTSSFSSGSNFRLTYHYRTPADPSVDRRDLLKLYGVDFVFETTAMGRRFDIVELFISIGSGIGMLIFATLISDMVTMWCLRNSSLYRNKKYMNVQDQQAEIERKNWRGVLSEAELNRAYM